MYKLKLVRISKGIKQKDLAKKIGITQAHLSNLEKGLIDPRKSIMIKISQELETPVEELFFSEDV